MTCRNRVWCECADNMVEPSMCNGCSYRPDPVLQQVLADALAGRPEAEDAAEDQSNGTNNNPSLSKPNQ